MKGNQTAAEAVVDVAAVASKAALETVAERIAYCCIFMEEAQTRVPLLFLQHIAVLLFQYLRTNPRSLVTR
jgi:hypothetical protein